jgi:perosamine synthetase
MRINWNEPSFDEKDLEEVSQVIKSAYINEGPKTKILEEEIKSYLGVKHVLLTTNATAALFMAVKADAIIRGVGEFEVIVPDMTMIATANAVEWAGGKPLLVDVEKNRMTIDVEKVRDKITPKTTAIIPVHILGRAVDMESLGLLAKTYNLTIIEDAAGALGSKHEGKFLGTLGKVGCFSLQSNKIATCGQGGILVTDDDKYYEVLRRIRDFGRMSNKEFIHKEMGYNLKFNDLSAALALSQFRKIEERKKLLIMQRSRYLYELNGVEGVKFFEIKDGEIPLWIDIATDKRKELVGYLNSKEIFPREIWPAVHRNPPYFHLGNDSRFPVASYLSENILWLPNGPAINNEQITQVCSHIKDFYNRERMLHSEGIDKSINSDSLTDRMEFKKIHEDKRGFIYLVKNLLDNNQEFTFLEIKKGFARGGCLHSKDEYYVVIKGKVRVISGHKEEEVSAGGSGVFHAFEPHAFIALEDSIVSEWGITTQEKEADIKDIKLREVVDKANTR